MPVTGEPPGWLSHCDPSSESHQRNVLDGVARVIDHAIGFVVSVTLARLLLPTDFALIGMAAVFIGFARHFADLGLGGGCVSLLDSLPHDATKQTLADAGAFIVCSKTASNGDSEGTPTVLLEAQAMGLPYVTTRHARTQATIPVENHWLLADEGDITSIGQRLLALATAPADRIEAVARAGRTHMGARHDLQINTGILHSVLEHVTGAGRSARDAAYAKHSRGAT